MMMMMMIGGVDHKESSVDPFYAVLNNLKKEPRFHPVDSFNRSAHQKRA
jgi:hypothetical protein